MLIGERPYRTHLLVLHVTNMEITEAQASSMIAILYAQTVFEPCHFKSVSLCVIWECRSFSFSTPPENFNAQPHIELIATWQLTLPCPWMYQLLFTYQMVPASASLLELCQDCGSLLAEMGWELLDKSFRNPIPNSNETHDTA